MRKLVVALGCVALLSAGTAQASSTVAVYGDAPYGPDAFAGTPSFIQNINADPDVSLVMHVGDIHSGSQQCTESYDQSVFDMWTAFVDPLVYVPGDNEWSDCHKVKEFGGKYNSSTGQIDYLTDPGTGLLAYEGGNPVKNLALVRSMFFPTPGESLGQNPIAVTSQAQTGQRGNTTDKNYVENVMWEKSNTLFFTLNIPGGSNNDADIWYGSPNASAEQLAEIQQRNAADLHWINTAFAQAARDHVGAIVIQSQADMWDIEDTAAHQTNYEPFIAKIAEKTASFGKPVLTFEGDSHKYRSDNPLVEGSACSGEAATDCSLDPWTHHPSYDVPNFHRVIVHGSTLPLEWLKLTITPGANNPTTGTSFGPFSWQRVTP